MDINSRINWHPGMEFNTETIKSLYDDMNNYQKMTLRAAVGYASLGLLPGTTFNNKGSFVRNTFEIPSLQCMAILASGQVIDINEPVSIAIPMLHGSEYYLTAAFGKEMVTFEHQGVSYVRPNYEYALKTFDEMSDGEFPLARFNVKDEVFNHDTSYIPPTLLITDDKRFSDYIKRYIEYLDTMVSHPNIDRDFGRRIILNYKFELQAVMGKGRTKDFVIITKEIAQAVQLIIVSQVKKDEAVEIPQPSNYDIQKWLKWLDDYLQTACDMLEELECEDQSIDVEALKAQIMNELYEKLFNDLYEKLRAKIKEELTEELTNNLQDTLTTYINERIKPAIIEELKTDLSDALYGKLYQALYDALFEALNIPRPVEEEDTFTPLI